MFKKTILGLMLILSFSSVYAETVLRLATTTSTENTGLLNALNPPFEAMQNLKIDVIAVGSGKAMKLGENGDVDVVLTHDPEAEEKFIKAGFGVDRKSVMHNDFILVGPEDDPADIKSAKSATEAMKKIAASQIGFVSRGDESGTHVKEKTLWQKAEIAPEGDWYLSTGQGMGAVLRIADDKAIYTLTDRGTYLAAKLKLAILFEGDKDLFNPYHVMAVNPKRHPHANYQSAIDYINYLTSEKGQAIISNFKIAGKSLFFPDAGKPESE